MVVTKETVWEKQISERKDLRDPRPLVMKCEVTFEIRATLPAAKAGSRWVSQVLQIGNKLSDVDIVCNSNNIEVTISTTGDDFSGMVYPKGLSENSTCLAEYEHAGNKIIYRLPLRSCNTMSHDVREGVEYFNTVVIQPHSKLVTSLGRGFHVRCRYQTKNNKTVGSEAANKYV
ncbi:ZP domain-containing protein [Trichonephila clavipes]|nr:ZP domain-containing protein [Trichonephila clavipes]